MIIRGVSGSDKTNETESPNRTKPKNVSDLVWFGSKPNRTNLNRSCLVWFSVFHFEIQETDESNRSNLTLHFTIIIPLHTHL